MCRTLTCGLLLLLPGPLLGQGRTLAPDVLQTCEARKALLQDTVLGPLNLGVKVTNRVAVLWGPVPSAQIAGQAVSLLQKVPGLIAVRNELEIDPDLNLLPQYLPEILPQESRLPPSPAQLTTRTRGEVADGQLPMAGGIKAGGQSTVLPTAMPGMPDHKEIEMILPSLRIPTGEPEIHRTPPEAIARLQKDSRFARIQVRLQAGQATLRADGNLSPSLHEFARLISRIPGIDRVVVEEK